MDFWRFWFFKKYERHSFSRSALCRSTAFPCFLLFCYLFGYLLNHWTYCSYYPWTLVFHIVLEAFPILQIPFENATFKKKKKKWNLYTAAGFMVSKPSSVQEAALKILHLSSTFYIVWFVCAMSVEEQSRVLYASVTQGWGYAL